MNSTDRDSNVQEDEANSTQGQAQAEDAAGEEEKIPLNLEIQVAEPSTCQRHVTVSVPRTDIDRYIGKVVDELLPKAEVPGFRPGRAPRKLIEARFKEHVKDQVKSSLLMDSMAQISDSKRFTAISEPAFDVDAITLPDDGPMTFEFDIEVRPEFEMPNWKGLKLKRPVHAYSEVELERHLNKAMERYAERRVLSDEPSAVGDFVKVNATFRVDDAVISQHRDLELRVLERVSFRDAKVENSLTLLSGVRSGDRREGSAKIVDGIDSPHAGKTATIDLEVIEVARAERPTMNKQFLEQLGGFESEGDVREFLRAELERQFKFRQHRDLRQQIANNLTHGANWELPQELLKRQSKRELDRAVMEMKSNGIGDEQIRAYANQLRHNILETTKMALKEHFILERIAELEEIEADPRDYDREIELIADQSNESPRRVRARLEKRGVMDSLRNQIIERKVIDLICDNAAIQDVDADLSTPEEFGVDVSIAEASEEAAIPEAKHGESGSSTLMPTEERK